MRVDGQCFGIDKGEATHTRTTRGIARTRARMASGCIRYSGRRVEYLKPAATHLGWPVSRSDLHMSWRAAKQVQSQRADLHWAEPASPDWCFLIFRTPASKIHARSDVVA